MKMKTKPKTYHCKTWQDVANLIEIRYPRLKSQTHERRSTELEKQMIAELLDDLHQMAKIADASCKELDSLGR
jgi:hypothetical protein